MDELQNCCRISGPAELQLIDSVLDDFAQLCERVGEVPDEERDLFSLAVSEILTNMIKHGKPSDYSGIRIHACLCVEWDRLTGMLSDTAQEVALALDNVHMPDPASESGRGLAISAMLLDGLQHTEEAGNHWSFWRSLNR